MDSKQAIAMIGHIREYIVENQADHEYAEPIDMAIEALKTIRKGYVPDGFMPIGYHDKVYAELQKRYFDLLELTRWIPVSERLPEEDGYVLAVFETCLPFVSMYFSGVKKFSCEGEEANPTHWMSLPNPPQEVE